MNLDDNVFDNPLYFRNELLSHEFININKIKKLDGKSLICVFFTAFCGVGCPFCFFHSPTYKKAANRFDDLENHFSSDAVDKFIKFANDANVGYLQISGGGEPFLELDAILKCIENITAERIIIVTSGSWAYERSKCEIYLSKLYEATIKNNSKPRVTVRVSISEQHSIKLKEKPMVNLINTFEKKYRDYDYFTLQLKTFENDKTLVNVLDLYYPGYKLELLANNGTDDENHIKVIPWKYNLKLKSGYEIIVGKSRVFNSNLRPNMYDIETIKNNEMIYDIDLKLSQNDNAAIVNNKNGENGLDWIVEYNGNVCTWQNRVQDNLLNIYEDSYSSVYNKTINDLLTYSYIDKGSCYREKILNEISPKTVLLMKAVNIRDYVGTLAFEDEKIRLYYNIRVIQDYLKEGKINSSSLGELTPILKETIKLSKEELIDLYKMAKYSIVTQELQFPISKNSLHDFLELVKLGHFELKKDDIRIALEKYNDISNEEPILSLNDLEHIYDLETERRLTKRLMKRKIIKNEKKEILYYLFRHGETNWNIEKRIKGQLEDLKTEFTSKGRIQINVILSKIKESGIEAIFTSDLYRTKETSKIINLDLKLPVYYSENFRGLNMGDFQGGLMSDFLNNKNVKKAFIDYDFVIPGGESINQLNERYIKGLNIIRDNYNYEKVAIISHGAAISNIKSKISDEKYEDIDYCVIMYKDGKYKVVDCGTYN